MGLLEQTTSRSGTVRDKFLTLQAMKAQRGSKVVAL
jgi:hypothetical protein